LVKYLGSCWILLVMYADLRRTLFKSCWILFENK
jgi:hypothetical protein